MQTLLAQVGESHRAIGVVRKGAALARSCSVRASSSVYRANRNLALIDLMFAGMRGRSISFQPRRLCGSESVFKVHAKGGRDRLAFVVNDETERIQQGYRPILETPGANVFQLRGWQPSSLSFSETQESSGK